MKLPYRKKAYIQEEKLTEYILSETHTVGRLKAKFFRSAGFNESNVPSLKEELLTITRTQEIKEVKTSEYGKKYIIDGKIKAPKGRLLKVTTVWIIETGKKSPRFVTTYPV